MIKAIMFDLDGTLLPLNDAIFEKTYLELLCKYTAHLGYEPNLLIKTIWDGVKLMIQNDGSKTNEQVFWQNFESVYGKDSLKDIQVFNKFYVTDFKKTKDCSYPTKISKQIIDFCNKNFEYVILATNPFFPKNGVLTRMNFIDLKEDDFDFVCSYETCSYCKPNPEFFNFLLKKFNLKPDEVIMFGNNTVEDILCANKANIKAYLVGDYIIDPKNIKQNYTHIALDEIIPILQKEKQQN